MEHAAYLGSELQKAEIAAWEAATALRQSRKKAAELLSERILKELAQLDMPRVQFSCEFTETELTALGADGVVFYMSANAGEALKPMSKVASGGELARIMLAVKSVLAKAENIGTMIFDEVDTVISGATSSRIGMRLKALAGETKQVICVTHSAQIAALAKNHLLISKSASFGRTETHVKKLSRDGRIKEMK